ncbi:adenosine kinase [Aureimonas endophytica]|uniref:Adenosine kinase n=1 Tax=Aureimonas endophytica TaxID=2027858 RepID=A0A917E9T3_9HYPH|nr:adenosine kinase [Aureimonas endophytica]GGE16938.1 adenosine kinase [Aureimonas endophytica]
MADIDVLTIGNAIVDIIAQVDEEFLVRHEVRKGSMTLIDAERATALYEAMGPAVETSGGSAANTAAGVVSLGGRGAYIGKVSDDALGTVYTSDIRAQKVHFATRPLDRPPPTARSMILVTPDGERSMSTYLGACMELTPEDIDEALVASAAVTYFEGYLWDQPSAKAAIRLAAELAHRHGRTMAFTLSDSFCVHRYRDEFLELMRSGAVDIVFANEAEALALYETDDLDLALRRLGEDTKRLALVTRSEKGCVVVEKDRSFAVEATPVRQLLDTTGAGDLFAGGFLRGYTAGLPHADSARLGTIAAAHIIEQIGPRPQQQLLRLPAAKAILDRIA